MVSQEDQLLNGFAEELGSTEISQGLDEESLEFLREWNSQSHEYENFDFEGMQGVVFSAEETIRLRGENSKLREANKLLSGQLGETRRQLTTARRAAGPRRRFEKLGSPIDRLPPHSIEYEQAVLGLYIKTPSLMQRYNQKWLQLCLYDLRHSTIHQSLMDLGDRADFVSLLGDLKNRECLETVGGQDYLESLLEAAEKSAKPESLDKYLGELEDKYLKREVMRFSTQTVGELYEGKYCPNLSLTVEDKVQAADIRTSSKEVVPITSMPEYIRSKAAAFISLIPFRFRTHEDPQAAVDEVMTEFKGILDRKGRPIISSGYKGLDRITHGIRPDRLVVIGARPKMGKTTLEVNIADNVARQGFSSLIFTYESSRQELIQKLIGKYAHFDTEKFAYFDEIENEEIERVNQASKLVASLPITIESGKPNLDYVVARSKFMKTLKPNLSLVIIDGLQSFAGYVPYQGLKSDIYYEVLKRLKREVAGALELTVIVTSQLKTEVDKRKDKKPSSVNDFSDCKGLAEVADSALMLYRPERYWPENPVYKGWMSVIPVAMRLGEEKSKTFRLGIDTKTANIYELTEKK